MARLATMTNSQLESFFAYGTSGNPNWYSVYLIDWRDWDSMSDAFKNFFDCVQVKCSKLTHVRKLGIIRAHQMGADRENIILLSKHTQHKVDTSYLPELPYSAMSATAGFDVYRREEYYIPRSYVSVPTEWVEKIFPWISRWRHQVLNSHMHDKGDAAKVFVLDLLPFMETVILQDGVHLIHEYPEHLHSNILLDRMAGCDYKEWAEQARATIAARQQEQDRLITQNSQYEVVVCTNQQLAMQGNNIIHEISNLRMMIQELRSLLQPQMIPQQQLTVCNSVQRIQQRITQYQPALPVALRESIALPNTDEVMVGEPIIPLIPARLHNTIEGNMELWLNSKLWTYDDRHDTSRVKLGWTQDLQQRYSRRKNVAMWVKLTAQLVMEVDMDWNRTATHSSK
jgi:hypothetical protein